MAEKSENSQANTRWWESYLVRYFLGFIIGAICIAIIAKYSTFLPGILHVMEFTGKAADGESKYGITAIVIVISLLGLAYCYIASTPITVLHFGRFAQSSIDWLSQFFWLGWALALVLLMLISDSSELANSVSTLGATLGLFILSSSIFWLSLEQKKHGKGFLRLFLGFLCTLAFFCIILIISLFLPNFLQIPSKISIARLLAVGMPVIWIGVAQYFILYKISTKQEQNFAFYEKLFSARRKAGAQDVRDTYSHLREHSNAVFIVAVEISILALVLAVSKIGEELKLPPESISNNATFLLAALCVWIVPTIFMWSRANAMERYFSETPDAFLKSESNSNLSSH